MDSSKLSKFLSLACAQSSVFRRWVHRDFNPQSGRLKFRPIYAPDEEAYANHQAIIDYLEPIAGPMPYAFGGVKGRSTLRNVTAHRCFPSGRFPRFWFQTDISDAYGSVRPDRLLDAVLFRAPELWDYESEVYRLLCRHCFVWEAAEGETRKTCRGLYTGGPASVLLFNLYCDHYLDGKLAALGLGYTRFLDDLTFSSHSPVGRHTRSRVMRAIREAGFQPNNRKTERVDLRKRALRVTGFVVHADGRIGLTKRYASELRALAHRAEKALDEIDRGALALFFPKGVSGSFGILVGLARSRGAPVVSWRDLFEAPGPPEGFSATEWSLLTRFYRIRSRMRTLLPRGYRACEPKAPPPTRRELAVARARAEEFCVKEFPELNLAAP